MRWLTTAVLAVLLVGLATFYYVYEIRQAPGREKAATVKDRLWKELEGKDVEEIVVRKGDAESLHLKKAGDAWSLAAPVSATADRARRRRPGDVPGDAPGRAGDRGQPPEARRLRARAAGRRGDLQGQGPGAHRPLGAKSPSGVWAYAQEGEKPAVLLVPEGLLKDAQKPPSEFRDRTLLAFERKDVKTVEVRSPAGQVVAAAGVKGADEWQLTAPARDGRRSGGDRGAPREAPGGEDQGVRDRRAQEPGRVRPGSADADHARGGRGGVADHADPPLRQGGAGQEGGLRPARGRGAVLLVDEELCEGDSHVAGGASGTRPSSPTTAGRLERVELESPKGKVTLALQDGKWRITAPVATPGRRERHEPGAVQSAGPPRARTSSPRTRSGSPPTASTSRRSASPSGRRSAKEPKTLLLAPGREKDRAYATTLGAGRPGVAAVDATALQDLARGVTDLRDRSLAEAFDTKDVTRVTIQRPSVTLTLDRTGAGEEDWQLAAPKKGKTRGGRVSELLWTLRNLKWKDLVAEQGWDPARYGLDAGATTVTLSGKDGQTIAALALGKQEAGVTYVRIPGQPALYAIDSKTLGDLPGTPEELLL